MKINIDILMFGFSLICGMLLFEIPSILRQKYIEKHIKKKHKKYSNSKWTMTRRYCAFYGYDLDVLQHDKKWQVRIEVARKGYNLNYFLQDKNILVRKAAEEKLKELNEKR